MPGPTARLLSLLSLLQTGRTRSGSDLAARLEVTPRTLRRDVDRLRELGYAVTSVPGRFGGYRLDGGTALPPLLFDADQAVAVALALQTVAFSGVEIDDGAERALATLRQVLPASLRARLDGARPATLAPESRVAPPVIRALQDAVDRGLIVRFDYADGEHPRRVEPHALVALASRWYLLAWDLERDDWRTFRLDRLTPRTPAGPRFTPRSIPRGDAARFVAARFRGGTGDAWPCVGEVRIAATTAEVAPWLSDADLAPQPDGSTWARVGAWSWRGVLSRLVALDVPIEILGPPELRTAAAELARFGETLSARASRPAR